MAKEEALARVGGKPGRQEGAAGVCLTALVANMREPVRAMGIVRVQRQRALDLRAGRGELPIL
jgi:hypothetical protein